MDDPREGEREGHGEEADQRQHQARAQPPREGQVDERERAGGREGVGQVARERVPLQLGRQVGAVAQRPAEGLLARDQVGGHAATEHHDPDAPRGQGR